jgi:DMAP1-binding protein
MSNDPELQSRLRELDSELHDGEITQKGYATLIRLFAYGSDVTFI